jgi:hypothetical protein
MNPEQDKQDELQKMLALKRHEAPSPRFFKKFSGEVLDRLHVPEPPIEQAWWQRLGLDSKPVLVCASGIVVCALLLVGLVASLRATPPKPVPRAADDTTHLVVAPPPNAATVPATTGNSLTNPAAQEIPRVSEPVVVSQPSPFSPIKLQPNRASVNPPPQSASPPAK